MDTNDIINALKGVLDELSDFDKIKMCCIFPVLKTEINKYNKMNEDNKYNTLVLCGGSIKGIYMLGSLQYLKDNNIINNEIYQFPNLNQQWI